MAKLLSYHVRYEILPNCVNMDQFELKREMAEGEDFFKINRMLVGNEAVLKKIYYVCCRGRAGVMSLETTVRFLCQKEGLGLTKSQAVQCYALTKLPLVDEKGDGIGSNSMYNRVNFVEF